METANIDPTQYILTATTKSLVNKNAFLFGTKNLSTGGELIIESDVVLRGDLSKISLGRFVCLGKGAVIHPSKSRSSKYGTNY